MVENEFASSALRSSKYASLWGLTNLNINFTLNFDSTLFYFNFQINSPYQLENKHH